MAEILHDQTSLSLLGAANDVVQLYDVWMIEHFLNHVLTLDFLRLDRKQNFDGNFFSVFFVVAFEDM